MKGIIFSLLAESVTGEHGEAAWDDVLDAAGVDGAYTSLGEYPDGEMLGLIDAAADRFQLSRVEFARWFGRRSIPLLAKSHGTFFKGHADAGSFLLTLTDVIQPDVRKLYPDAATVQR